MKATTLSLLALAVFVSVGHAASIAISIDSGSKSIRDELNAALSGGNSGINGDGTKVQLGYFSDGTQANPFGSTGSSALGAFTALTGPGTPFGISFTIGDQVVNGTGDGELFVDSFSISTGINDALFPAAGVPLVLRFFNGAQTSILDLSNTSGTWNWLTPNTPPPSRFLSFNDPGLVFRATGDNARGNVSAAATNLQTNNSAVPEPTSAALLTLGLTALVARRRRAA